MILKRFVQKYDGVKVDYDKAHGPQCVDLVRLYSDEVLNIEQLPKVTGAKDLWENHGVLKQCQAVGPGDLLVYGATATNPYGHVCILVSLVDSDTFIVFEQDGFKQDGARLRMRDRSNLLGGLYK